MEKNLHCLVTKALLHLDFIIKSNCTFAFSGINGLFLASAEKIINLVP